MVINSSVIDVLPNISLPLIKGSILPPNLLFTKCHSHRIMKPLITNRITPMTNDDDALFRKAMEAESVKPLKIEARVHLQPPRKERTVIQQKRMIASVEADTAYDGLSDDIIHKVAPEESIACAKAGLQQQQLKKLKLGQIPWEASIDLHGYRLDEARTALVVFLRRCQNRGLKCVKVVHGKGLHRVDTDVTIKSALVNWLQQLPNVMGFASCTLTDGGTGAVYVLLKRLKMATDKPE